MTNEITKSCNEYRKGYKVAMRTIRSWCDSRDATIADLKNMIDTALELQKRLEEQKNDK